MGEPEERREQKEKKKIFEEIASKNLPDLLENNLHIQEAQYSKRCKSRCIIVKTLKAKDKEKTLKAGVLGRPGALGVWSMAPLGARTQGLLHVKQKC